MMKVNRLKVSLNKQLKRKLLKLNIDDAEPF